MQQWIVDDVTGNDILDEEYFKYYLLKKRFFMQVF